MNGVDKTHKSWWATELFPARNSCRALEGHQPIRLPRFLSLRRRRVFEFGQQIPDRIRISSAAEAAAVLFVKQQKRLSSFKVHATVAEKDGEPKWWERNAGLNMIDIHSTEEFLSALSQAGDKLVIVEFYGTWCGSCRALLPKLCKTAEEHPDIIFLKVNFNENKPMCKRLNVKVVPSFHFYRGADGLLESFSCSLAKFQKIKEAIEKHNSSRCSLGPPLGVGDLDLLGPS